MGAAVVSAVSRCIRIYINEPTKCLKIKDFRFWHRSKIVHYEYIFRKAAVATACVFGAFAEVRKGQAPHDLASTIQLEKSKNKATLCLDLLRFLRRRVVLHCRSRGATGSHPSGTPVARQERPARQPPSPASGRRDGLASASHRSRDGTRDGN